MKQVKVCLGRFAPFTLGHLKLATYKDLKGPDKEQQDKLREQPDLKEITKQKTVILAISTPNEKVDTRHPFSDQVMKDEFDLIKKNYKDEIEDILSVKSADICAWGELLKQNGYQASVWLTGSDEFKMYKYMAIKVPEYEEHNRDNRDCKDAYTKSFYVENIERTDDGDFVSSISATKVRQALLDGDKDLFIKMMPKGMEKYFDEFKEKVENAPEPVKKTTKKKIKEGMMTLKEYIIQESLKDKIKSLINKFKKEKVPEKVYKEEDLLEYKDKEITLEDGDEIFDIYINTLPYKSDRTSKFEKNAFKQGLLDYAWCNYSKDVDNKFRFNKFGDDYANEGYSRANHESGYDWNEVGVGMTFVEPFFWGWKCAQKLNLKYNSKNRVKLPLNKFTK